ncbi:DUF2163 domain-containing protein [Sphingomonas naphthae]|uniref:DUF2163 domain-containing protein n=1 Tax=Sphingomonas naphthae TaxID=1813468 RepID=A0ABY7TKC6_9SPHN|nr:DUF2163 domain-containing protein [Sphingomonas naphthae]WCT73681.1 DUF2163 domain-containing protein [Sphingomonas naphthae]
MSGASTLALCWRLDRRDGVTLGFTAHDRDIARDGLVYRAAPGMLPSAITRSDGFAADTLDVSGALTADAIREEDLRAGRWDGARVRLFAVDWADPQAPAVFLTRGELGDISTADGAFTAELRGAVAALERPVVEMTAPDCRADLGDRRCRVNMAGRVRVLRVSPGDEAGLVEAEAAGPEDNAYGYGRLRWLDGANSGLASAILRSAGAEIWLREPPPFPVEADTLVELTEGCDRLFATCCDRFANAANFRGEPYLPGNDLLTRYPGA